MVQKGKILLLYVSRYNLDNGVRGGKAIWSELATAENENSRGLQILTSPCPFECVALCGSAPCVCEAEFSLKAANANGKSITQLVIDSLHPTGEKSFESDRLKFTIK